VNHGIISSVSETDAREDIVRGTCTAGNISVKDVMEKTAFIGGACFCMLIILFDYFKMLSSKLRWTSGLKQETSLLFGCTSISSQPKSFLGGRNV